MLNVTGSMVNRWLSLVEAWVYLIKVLVQCSTQRVEAYPILRGTWNQEKKIFELLVLIRPTELPVIYSRGTINCRTCTPNSRLEFGALWNVLIPSCL